MNRLRAACGYASEKSRCAVVSRPGIATVIVSGSEDLDAGAGDEQRAHPCPSAPPERRTP